MVVRDVSMMPQTDFDVLINGGGMVGITLALCLASADLSVAIIENSTPPSLKNADELNHSPSDLRVFAITKASEQIFKHIGVWQEILSARMGVMQQIKVWDQFFSGSVHFSAKDAGLPNLGVIIEQKSLLNALYKKVGCYPNIKLFSSAKLAQFSVHKDKIIAVMQSGESLQAKLLVGSDGARSWVKQQAGIASTEKSYHQIAVVATIHSDKPHNQTAFQRFNDTGALALLPLSQPNQLSIVWSVAEDLAQSLLTLSDHAFEAKLSDEVDNVIGQLSLLSQRMHFPLIERHAKSYFHDRVVLVGDAAHVIHPLAGQGVNLGLMDAYVLANILTQAHLKKRDIGSQYLLKRYERKRRFNNQGMIYLMRAFKEGFITQQPTIQLIRNKGLDWVDKHALIKRFFIQQAQGTLPSA